MAGLLAALALGFGVVIGTAISPNLAGIVAAPAPPVVAEAPPETPSPASTGGGGGGSPAPVAASAPTAVTSTIPSGSSAGGEGGGSGHRGENSEKPAAGITFSGTVVRANPVAQSYTVSSGGGLIAIHADALPEVGDQVETEVRKLNNGTYAEEGARNAVGTADQASFLGTVSYCADLEQPSAPCDGSSSADHYVYTVSSLGASIQVSAPHPATAAPPPVGSQVQVGVHIGAAFQPVDPLNEFDWAQDPECTPPYDEQKGLPDPPVVTKEITQTSLSVTGQANSVTLESVVQTKCPRAGTPTLILSADDLRESGHDLAPLDVPGGIDPNRLNPGQAVQTALDIAADGALTLEGITSDQGAGGADDASQGQGTLTGS
jgi:hypothetical protein